MTFMSGFAIYFIIWWLTLFMVLPHGVRSQAEADDVVPGTDPGAPVSARLWTKLAVNTLLSGAIFGAWLLLTEVYGYHFSDIPSLFPEDL